MHQVSTQSFQEWLIGCHPVGVLSGDTQNRQRNAVRLNAFVVNGSESYVLRDTEVEGCERDVVFERIDVAAFGVLAPQFLRRPRDEISDRSFVEAAKVF